MIIIKISFEMQILRARVYSLWNNVESQTLLDSVSYAVCLSDIQYSRSLQSDL